MVYTSAGPFSALILGYILKKSGVRWVADLRDPWTDNYVITWPSKFHWFAARFVEKKLLKATDLLIVNTEAVRDLYVFRGIKELSKIRVVTNGFD